MSPDLRPRSPVLVFAAALLGGCQSSPTVISSAPPAPRSVSVTGTAELRVAPDELVVSVGVDTYAVEAQAAKKANDEAMAELLRVTKDNGVEPTNVRTENFTLLPRYDGRYESRHVIGYEAKKTLVVTLSSAEKAESLLAELFKGGANRIDGVTMTSTKIIEQRKEARKMAVAAAREKAEAMAAALGQKVGRPLKIDEDPGPSSVWSPWGNRPGNVLLNAFDQNTDSRPVVGESMATGKIRVTANVAVTFELAD